VGQYVSRGGKQYYKGDDGKLYANFRDANLSSSPADQAIRGVGQGLGYVGGVLKDVLNAQGGPSFLGGRSAVASPSGRPEGTQALLNRKPVQWAIENGKGSWVRDYQNEGEIAREILAEQAAKRTAGQPLDLSVAPPAPILPPPGGRTPITSPNTTFQRADEEYKTLLSQYGGTSGVQQLAGMQSLPTGFTPTGGKQAAGLEDYYAAQQAVGAKNIGEITGALGYQKGSAMEQWAQKNQGLAMREFNKKFPAGAPTQGPNDEAIRAAMGGGTYFPSEGSPSPIANPPSLAGQTSFGNIANPVAPTKAWNQGAMVDANRGKENLVPQQEAKTTPDGTMPNLETTAQPQTVLDRTGNFLNNINSLIKTIAPTGLSSIIYNPYQ
jgi:hypothetical protein